MDEKKKPKAKKAANGQPAIPTRTSREAGRPTLYSEELVDKICDHISKGETLSHMERTYDWMPDRSTIWNWTNQYPTFFDKLKRARHQQGWALFEEGLDIARQPMYTNDDASIARVRVQAFQWAASRLARQELGIAREVKEDSKNEVPDTIDQVVKQTEALLEIIKKSKKE